MSPADPLGSTTLPRWAAWAIALAVVCVLLVGWGLVQMVSLVRASSPEDVVSLFVDVLETDPGLTVQVEGQLSAELAVELARHTFVGEAVDEGAVRRWVSVYPALSWDVLTGDDGWTRTTLRFEDRPVTEVASPPRGSEATVVGFGVNPEAYAALASALSGVGLSPDEVGQRLLGTPAAAAVTNPYLEPDAIELVWIEVADGDAARVTGADVTQLTDLATVFDLLSFDAGGTRSGRSVTADGELAVDEAMRLAAVRLLTGVGMEELLLFGDTLPTSTMPALPLPSMVAEGASGDSVTFELDVLDARGGDAGYVSPHAHLSLVDIVASGGKDVAAIVAEVPDPLVWTITADATDLLRPSSGRSVGPPAGAAVLGPDALRPIDWVATRTDRPDAESMEDLIFTATGLGVEMEARREADGAYPTTTSTVIERASVLLDPWYPRSLTGWLVRLEDDLAGDACFEALHDEGWLWSMRASSGWAPAPGGC